MKAILEESEQITMLFPFNDTYWEYIGTITKQLKLVSYYEEKKKKNACVVASIDGYYILDLFQLSFNSSVYLKF